ncbi:MAG: 2-oxoglutarate dehydrogenase E1 component [Holosporales bacterium]
MDTKSFEASTFLDGANATFLEHLYSAYVQNPASVDATWAAYFNALGDDVPSVLKLAVGASWAPRAPHEDPTIATGKVTPLTAKPYREGSSKETAAHVTQEAILDSIRAMMLIRVYRVRGHLNAKLDPLGLEQRGPHPELDPAHYGFSAQDMDRPIFIGGALGREKASLREILAHLQQTYCGTATVEFMHIQDAAQKDWIQKKFENENRSLTPEERIETLKLLSEAEGFERFLQVKYTGAKRFGLEGGESFIPALHEVIATSARHGVQEAILGMAHRGRLNVLANIMQKPARDILAKFEGHDTSPEGVQGSGDVKYHLGASADRDFRGKPVHLSLTANPSHLEAVNPVVAGKVRAKQTMRADGPRTQVMGILVHGDAAFAGQGVVSETLSMSELRGYRTGGTLHLVINNQIGFTTSPVNSRSSAYCTDVAKAVQAPIFHVNGDDPDAVVWAARLAAEYRAQFQQDVVLDIVCYRRHGHNEMDEPAFTQPLMYKAIRAQPSTRTLYAQKLLSEGVVSSQKAEDLLKAVENQLQAEFQAAEKYTSAKADWLDGAWSAINAQQDFSQQPMTGIEEARLQMIGAALTKVPEGFSLNSKLTRLLQQKQQMFTTKQGFDWATAEALAFGATLLEGHVVRLSGQDCGRGTFSQRHAVLIDQETGAPYLPLNSIAPGQAEVEIVDSLLSEFAVLGFELGYSLADPNALVMWEAQFGDFANGAQVMVDQFISSGETKWQRMSGLVMLLPHGMEGQGPEHSSARPERYLQLCAENNMQVANCSTPANYFHILRRQLHWSCRKPLILMTPKSLLRHRLAVSNLDEMAFGTTFRPVLPEMDKDLKPKQVRRVVLCTGKVYYDLLEARQAEGISDVALIRVEQLYPFPAWELEKVLAPYAHAEMIWCQEEPENMGYWNFVDRRLERVLLTLKAKFSRPTYVGRPEAASPATGLHSRHEEEQKALVREALHLKNDK